MSGVEVGAILLRVFDCFGFTTLDYTVAYCNADADGTANRTEPDRDPLYDLSRLIVKLLRTFHAFFLVDSRLLVLYEPLKFGVTLLSSWVSTAKFLLVLWVPSALF